MAGSTANKKQYGHHRKGLPAPFFQQHDHQEKRIGNDHITWHKNI